MINPPRLSTLTVILVLASALPAAASSFCEVPSTSDGFVALRAGPSKSATLVARMKAGDEVMILEDTEPRGRWYRVQWWRGQDRLDKGFEHTSGKGWVHGSLLNDCG